MIRIRGIEKVSLLDYPDKISSIIFTYGCNLRCPFCHNPELVIQTSDNNLEVSEEELINYLQSRRGLIDAVVITGGEPLIYDDIGELISSIKKMGYLIKLDTNGFFPKRLFELIEKNLLNYIAMDIKCPLKEYNTFSGDPEASKKVLDSINIVMTSGLDYEFRTTYVKGLHRISDGDEITRIIPNAKKYYIQNFRSGKTIDPKLDSSYSFTEDELKQIHVGAKKNVKNSYIR